MVELPGVRAIAESAPEEPASPRVPTKETSAFHYRGLIPQQLEISQAIRG